MNREALLYYSVSHQGDWTKIATCIKEQRKYEKIEIERHYVTIFDEHYPSCFRKLRYPPWVLFYYGDLNLLNNSPIGIIGARQCSVTAINNTHYIVDQLKKRHTIVSGLAKGVDAHSHLAAINAKTVAFLGCGIDRIYPKENQALFKEIKKNHCLISEYPNSTAPYRHHFPWRNRLIAASSELVIVVEAKYKSGTMRTVDACNELSVPVYCVPSSFLEPSFKGCNYLISCGAQILLESDLERI